MGCVVQIQGTQRLIEISLSFNTLCGLCVFVFFVIDAVLLYKSKNRPSGRFLTQGWAERWVWLFYFEDGKLFNAARGGDFHFVTLFAAHEGFAYGRFVGNAVLARAGFG